MVRFSFQIVHSQHSTDFSAAARRKLAVSNTILLSSIIIFKVQCAQSTLSMGPYLVSLSVPIRDGTQHTEQLLKKRPPSKLIDHQFVPVKSQLTVSMVGGSWFLPSFLHCIYFYSFDTTLPKCFKRSRYAFPFPGRGSRFGGAGMWYSFQYATVEPRGSWGWDVVEGGAWGCGVAEGDAC